MFSISREKIYNRLNDNSNLYFNSGCGPKFGSDCFTINNKILRGDANYDPF